MGLLLGPWKTSGLLAFSLPTTPLMRPQAFPTRERPPCFTSSMQWLFCMIKQDELCSFHINTYPAMDTLSLSCLTLVTPLQA